MQTEISGTTCDPDACDGAVAGGQHGAPDEVGSTIGGVVGGGGGLALEHPGGGGELSPIPRVGGLVHGVGGGWV